MINRTMVRTRVIQTLFAYYKDGDKTPQQARKELLKSFSDTYNLYAILLALMDELTTYASQQIAADEQKARVTHSHYVPNYNFAHSRLAQLVFNNHQLRHILDDQKLRWESGLDAIPALWRTLGQSDFYQDFMRLDAPTLEDEKVLWRKIYSELLPESEALEHALEEMELHLDQANWTVDLPIVLSYVIKTIKRFAADSDSEQPLLPMFDKEEELAFGQQLLQLTIEHKDDNDALIHAHLKNWDKDRLAYMDNIILQVALTEINHFPEIAVQISMNEYIELAKEYSSEKSHLFINGILDEILKSTKHFKVNQ